MSIRKFHCVVCGFEETDTWEYESHFWEKHTTVTDENGEPITGEFFVTPTKEEAG